MEWGVSDITDQTGRIAIVTGANSGIGFETAKALAAKGARVILACRNEAKGQAAVDAIQAEVPAAALELRVLDISSLASVRAFAQAFNDDYAQLDLLINNAGIMAVPFEPTVDGFEPQFGTNHLGHFALTGLLLDRLTATENARIVTVSSHMHRLGKIDFDNLNAEKGFKSMRAYNLSKLANLLFTCELDRRLRDRGLSAISVGCHPGATASNLGGGSSLEKFTFFTQPVAGGALPTLRAATDNSVVGGQYYGPKGFLRLQGAPELEKPARRSQDGAVAKRLWQVSEQMTGVSFLSASD